LPHRENKEYEKLKKALVAVFLTDRGGWQREGCVNVNDSKNHGLL
jgi:hypothetical protein